MKTKTAYFLSLSFFILLVVFIPENINAPELGETVFTISTFLFGLLAGFYIAVATTDYNNLKNILAIETGGWIALFNYLNSFNKKIASEVADMIDVYIIKAFNFEIIDYASSTEEEFSKISKAIYGIPFKKESKDLEEAKKTMSAIILSRQQLTVLGAKTLSLFQWVVLIILGFLVIFSAFALRTESLFFDVVTILISSTIVLVLFLLRDIDLYVWNEKTFGYDIFENVLESIGKLPYYPKESISKGRVIPEDKEYRVGSFINFPKSLERKIEIQTNKIMASRKTFDFWK